MKLFSSCLFSGFFVLLLALNATANNLPVPFKIGSHTSRFIQTYTGINYATSKTASILLAFGLHYELGGKVKAKVATFSFTDLLAGKVKSVDIKLYNSKYKGADLGQIHLCSKTPFWYQWHKSHQHKKGMQNALLMQVDGHLTDENLAHALASPEVSAAMHMIKLDLPGLGKQQLQFLNPQVALDKDKIVIATTLITDGAPADTGIFATLTGCPYMAGSKILIKDLELNSPNISNPADFAAFTQGLLNPLVDLGKYDRRDHAFRLTSMQIDKKKFDFSGNLLMAPKQ